MIIKNLKTLLENVKQQQYVVLHTKNRKPYSFLFRNEAKAFRVQRITDDTIYLQDANDILNIVGINEENLSDATFEIEV